MGVTALVVGSAPCVHDDLEAARSIRPWADLIPVNYSVAIAYGRIAVTHHAENAERMKAIHRARWGDEVEIHMPKKKVMEQFKQHVDKTWSELAGTGGTSAWGATKIAKLMGYREVIMCGCPLEVTPHGGFYHDPEILEVSAAAGAKRDRGEPFGNKDAVRAYQRYIESDVVLGRSGAVYSMSGWTRKLLGAPNGR